MKVMLATLIGLVTAAYVSTASAHVVLITTSIPAMSAADEGQLQTALAGALDDVVLHAIRFTPTAVTLEDMRQVGDWIYLMLLIVDEEGEALMRQLEADETGPSQPPAPEPADNDNELRT